MIVVSFTDNSTRSFNCAARYKNISLAMEKLMVCVNLKINNFLLRPQDGYNIYVIVG